MRSLAGFFAFIFILLIMAGGVALFFIPKMDGAGPLTAPKDLVIASGSGASSIGHQLEKEGVVENHWLFRLRYLLAGRPKLKAGEYLFNPHISIRDAIAMMAAGDVVIRKVSVPEGWTSAEVVEALKKEAALSGNIPTVPTEGTILPDTYRFVFGDAREVLLKQMEKEMQEAIDAAWAQRDPATPYQTPQQMVTLASIIEKETAIPAERPRVAGVYINRLKKGMLLQSDPTVIYGLTQGRGQLGRLLTTADLAKATPYNTYMQPGLPPGPIANPGKASLMAAAKPEKNDYLYFVADGSGGHKFSATLDEHEKNVADWRKVESGAVKPEVTQQKSAAPAPTPAVAPAPVAPATPAAPVPAATAPAPAGASTTMHY